MTALLRRLLGLGLLALASLPLHRLLASDTGLAGQVTRRVAEAAWSLGLWGSVATVGVAFVLAVMVGPDPLAAIRNVGERLSRFPRGGFAFACFVLGVATAGSAALLLFHGRPTSVDEMVQLLNARTLLAGRVPLPLPGDATAWMVQNSLLVDGGWVSIYPPMHTLLLAGGLAIGAPWLVGPLAAGVMAGASAWAFDALFPEHRVAARVGGILVALSPFVAFLGGTELSHTTAGAFVALALAFALRAADGSVWWSVAAGAAVGGAVAARPWTGIVLCGAILLASWLPAERRASSPAPWLVRRAAGLALGGLPFAAFLLGWNARLFGSPFRLGYMTAFGPSHGLGWHTDPWGNAYGLREALAYTGADVTQLGIRLFEAPLPALAVVGVGLLVARTLPRGTRVLLAWAGGSVLTAATYWHHGIHFGPRLWLESAPAWIGLWAMTLAVLWSTDSLPARARKTVAWAAVLSLLGGAAFLPGTVAAYGADDAALAQARIPAAPSAPALLFVHGSWASRVSGRLTAEGMRRDSVETALRRNDLCAVDAFARWRRVRQGPPPALDFTRVSGSPTRLRSTEISPGNRILVDPSTSFSPACAREARSDAHGTVELEPLLWQAPPLPGAALVVARDLGPEANEVVRRAWPGYRSWAVVDGGANGPRVVEYDQAMTELWGDTAPAESAGG